MHEQLCYPHFSLGQISDFIGLNIQFHQLTFDQFMAGETKTILTCHDEEEWEDHIQLLNRIAQWYLRTNVSWPQIRNAYALILRRVENRNLMGTDWNRFEQHIYDQVSIPSKAEKTKNQAGQTTKVIETT